MEKITNIRNSAIIETNIGDKNPNSKKQCSKCNKIKSTVEFRRNHKTEDGHIVRRRMI